MTASTHSLSLANTQWRGTILVALSGMCYGLMGYLGTRLLQNDFSVANMLFWRFFVAMCCMLFATFVFRKNVVFKTDHKKSFFKTILIGVLSYSGTSAFYFLACEHIGTGLAMVIFFSYPVFVTLFGLLKDEWQINKYVIASLATVMIGLLCLKGHGENALNLIGILLSIVSALFYATYVYTSRNNAKEIDSSLLTLLICFGTSTIFFIVAYTTHTFSVPNTLSEWLDILAVGIIATAVPIQLLLDGLKYISPVKACILSVLEPVVTVLVGFALLHETMSFMQAVGVMIVLIGAILIQFEKTPKDDYQNDATQKI